MATHDYDIANQSGAAFRTDLNNALAAIQSNNSNSSSPATTVAYQWWADTSTNIMKLRNSSNNAWIELFQLDGTITLENGSASTPALANRSDLNTGVFFSAADTFDIATGGVGRVQIDSSETTFNESGATTDFRIEGGTSTHLFFLDASSNRIGIGASTVDRQVHIEGTDNVLLKLENNQTLCLMEFEDTDTTAGNRPSIGADANNLIFFTGGSTSGGFDSTGRFGIGTLSMGTFNQNADDVVINNSANGGLSIITGTSSTGRIAFGDANDDNIGQIRYDHGSNNMVFDVGTVEMMRIESDKVRISHSTYAASGHADDLIVGIQNSGHNRGITILNHAGQDGRLMFAGSNNNDGEIKYSHGGNTMQFNVEAENVVVLDNTSVQNNPLMKLKKPNAASNVQSHMIHLIVGGNDRGALIAASAFGGSAIVGAISDYRVKTNIRNYTDGWDNIKALPVKIFDINKEGEEAKDIKGWIAHEVQAVIPEAVCGTKDAKKEDGSDDYQSLGYNVFMPDVVGALQTAMTKIETLETKVAALEAA